MYHPGYGAVLVEVHQLEDAPHVLLRYGLALHRLEPRPARALHCVHHLLQAGRHGSILLNTQTPSLKAVDDCKYHELRQIQNSVTLGSVLPEQFTNIFVLQ